jgi:hypothetical protein
MPDNAVALYAEHVLLLPESGRVSGVIDWSDAAIADPAADFAALYWWLGAGGARRCWTATTGRATIRFSPGLGTWPPAWAPATSPTVVKRAGGIGYAPALPRYEGRFAAAEVNRASEEYRCSRSASPRQRRS